MAWRGVTTAVYESLTNQDLPLTLHLQKCQASMRILEMTISMQRFQKHTHTHIYIYCSERRLIGFAGSL
jgi:hypothetical protein